MSGEPVVEINNARIYYDKSSVILDKIRFKIEPSEFIAVIGPNGSGKSTLLKTIAGIIKPASGELKVFGSSISKAKRIAYLPQLKKHEILFPIPVYDVVALARYAQKKIIEKLNEEDEAIIEDNLRKMEMWQKKDRCFCELSEGQKQRVLIARTLATDSRLILMDEPTTGLDSASRENLYIVFQKEKEKGRSILIVSHDIPEIYSYADKVACIMKKIYWNTDPSECKNLL